MLKLYENLKKYIKENYKTLVLLLIILLFFTIKLPYYISAPGGIINTKEKINISSNFNLKGSLNMAYVSQYDGNIPTLLYAIINPNWDIESEKEVTTGNESIKNVEYRNKMLLKEANNNALLVAYDKANINYKEENNKIYITYVDDMAKTDLKVQDQIIKIGSSLVTSKQVLYDYIKDKKPKDKIFLTVLRDGKEKKCQAVLLDINKEAKVGIIITQTMDIKSDHHVDLSFKDTESGSSGGLMMALTVYSYLTKKDITKGKKVVGTGTIDREGNVGEISGVKYKLMGAVKEKADVFLVPKGNNYNEAKKLKNKNGYNIDIIPVQSFEDALNYLE